MKSPISYNISNIAILTMATVWTRYIEVTMLTWYWHKVNNVNEKVMAKVKVFFATDRWTHRHTGQNIYSLNFILGVSQMFLHLRHKSQTSPRYQLWECLCQVQQKGKQRRRCRSRQTPGGWPTICNIQCAINILVLQNEIKNIKVQWNSGLASHGTDSIE